MADLSAASVEDIASFFRTYYAPNNAVIAIVGDVDTKTTLAKIEKYFGTISRQPAPPKVDMTEPAMQAERRMSVEDALVRLPRVDFAYKIPASDSPDDDALSVLSTILSGGRSARFYESLVRQKQVASNVNTILQESRGPNLFYIIGVPAPNAKVGDLETAIDAEIERIKNGPIADWELEKARIAAKRRFVSTMGSTLSRAVELSQNAMFYNDPEMFTKRADRLQKVTAEDVQRVARKYFTKENRAVVITMPKAGAGRGAS
jgi:predicted Zn-dependent peptidase